MARKHHSPRVDRATVPVVFEISPAVQLPALVKVMASARMHLHWSPARRALVVKVAP
jgi:hypothetical protein